jgi:hypothetical protein
MAQLTQAELDRLLNQPIYSWDTATMLSGVVDFLEFSEGNLSWQRQREVQKAREEGATVEFDPPDEHLTGQYRFQLIEAAEHRFDVSLSQSIRYGGLVAFITVVEMCAKTFAQRLTKSIPKVPDGENEHIHLLVYLNQESSSGCDGDISDLKNLVYVRNCIVHAAGLVERHKFGREIREIVRALNGFAIWDEDFLGTSIRVEKGAVENYAKRATEWVPKLHERCVTIGILKG